MLTRFLLFVATLLALCGGCQEKKMDAQPYLNAVKDGQLHFSDGSSQSIPHWGDPAWTHLFLVRHAEKAKDDPKDPSLTAEGQARAERLGRIMAEAGLDSVYASPYKRTQLTAEPVMRRGKTPPVIIYLPDKQVEWTIELLENTKGMQILVVGHQNTVPQMLNQLNGEGFHYENIADADFGRFFVAATQGVGKTTVIEARY